MLCLNVQVNDVCQSPCCMPKSILRVHIQRWAKVTTLRALTIFLKALFQLEKRLGGCRVSENMFNALNVVVGAHLCPYSCCMSMFFRVQSFFSLSCMDQSHYTEVCAAEIWIMTLRKINWYKKCCWALSMEVKEKVLDYRDSSHCTLVKCIFWFIFFFPFLPTIKRFKELLFVTTLGDPWN